MFASLNEILLLIALVIILVTPKIFLQRISQPTQTYIKTIGALILITLVWLDADKEQWGWELVLTIVVVASVFKSWKENKKTAA